MAEAHERAQAFLSRVRTVARILRYGSRETSLAVIGFLLIGGAASIYSSKNFLDQALNDISVSISPALWSLVAIILFLAGGLLLLFAAVSVWRKVSVPADGHQMLLKLPALKGVAAFGPQDAELFSRLGRKTELERLRDWILDDQRPLIALMGESGTGKTSVLRAGLAGILASDKITVIYWEAQPTEAESKLTYAIRTSWGDTPGAPHTFLSVRTAVAARRCVVIIDQMEQLSSERHESIFRLLRDVVSSHPPYMSTWVVAFRRGFSAEWRDFELELPNTEKLRIETLSLKTFSREQARQVIATLSDEAHLTIEQAVVDELVDELMLEGGVAPVDIGISLLVLSEVIEKSKSNFSLRDFKTSGGQAGLLTRYIDSTLRKFTEAERRELLQALLQLISFGSNQRLAEGRTLLDLEAIVRPQSVAPFADGVRFMASSKARVLEELGQGTDVYRLAHERLIPPIMSLSGAERAATVLDEAFHIWSRDKKRRHLLAGSDLRLVLEHYATMGLSNNRDKDDYIQRSRRRTALTSRTLFSGILASSLILLAGIYSITQGSTFRPTLTDIRLVERACPEDIWFTPEGNLVTLRQHGEAIDVSVWRPDKLQRSTVNVVLARDHKVGDEPYYSLRAKPLYASKGIPYVVSSDAKKVAWSSTGKLYIRSLNNAPELTTSIDLKRNERVSALSFFNDSLGVFYSDGLLESWNFLTNEKNKSGAIFDESSRLWTKGPRIALSSFDRVTGSVTSIEFSTDDRLALRTEDGYINGSALALSPSGRFAIGTYNGEILGSARSITVASRPINAMAFLNERQVIVGGDFPGLFVVDIQSADLPVNLVHSSGVKSIALSKNYVAYSTLDSTLIADLGWTRILSPISLSLWKVVLFVISLVGFSLAVLRDTVR